ncbi:unnamed protein product [Ixodes pacificus]
MFCPRLVFLDLELGSESSFLGSMPHRSERATRPRVIRSVALSRVRSVFLCVLNSRGKRGGAASSAIPVWDCQEASWNIFHKGLSNLPEYRRQHWLNFPFNNEHDSLEKRTISPDSSALRHREESLG